MKYAIIIVRVLLGLIFAVLGSNAFLHFAPMPKMEGLPAAFMGALIQSGYIYPIAIIQMLGGLLLLLGGRFVALGLTLLGPIIVNIVFYHIFIDRTGLPIAVVVSILALFLFGYIATNSLPSFGPKRELQRFLWRQLTKQTALAASFLPIFNVS